MCTLPKGLILNKCAPWQRKECQAVLGSINQLAIVLPLYFGGSFPIMNKHYDGISKSQKISIRNGKKGLLFSFQDLNGELDKKGWVGML